MSAPTKTATAPVAAKPGRKPKVVRPALDLTALSVSPAEAPRVQRKASDKPNPFTAHLADSWANKTVMRKSKDGDVFIGAGRQVIVPTVNVKDVETLIRQAANKANLGSAIDVKNGPFRSDDGKVTVPAGKSRVRFAAKSRKQRRKNVAGPVTVTTTQTQSPATPAAVPAQRTASK